MRSLSEFGMSCGFPYASMWATAQNVVPRSIPTDFRFVGLSDMALFFLVSDFQNVSRVTFRLLGRLFFPVFAPACHGELRRRGLSIS